MVFKDTDVRKWTKIARKDIWVGAVATRTVVREMWVFQRFYAEQSSCQESYIVSIPMSLRMSTR